MEPRLSQSADQGAAAQRRGTDPLRPDLEPTRHSRDDEHWRLPGRNGVACDTRPASRRAKGDPMRQGRYWARSCGLGGLMALLLPGAPTPKKQPYTTWSANGGTSDSMQYSALTQINKSNVSQLQQVWFYRLPGRAELAFSPLIAGKIMYVAGKGNRSVVALDAATGQEIWTHPTEGTTTERGYAYWASKDGSDQRIIFSANHLLQEVNAKTG